MRLVCVHIQMHRDEKQDMRGTRYVFLFIPKLTPAIILPGFYNYMKPKADFSLVGATSDDVELRGELAMVNRSLPK